jgi:hypothetical protein
MKKRNKSILSIALALVMAFSLFGASAFAQPISAGLIGTAIPPDPTNPNCSTYEIPSSPPLVTSAVVSFVIEAGSEVFEGFSPFRVEIPSLTLMSTSPKVFTVTDLLIAVAQNPSNMLGFLDANGQPITSSSTYVDSVVYNIYEWENGQLGFDGWVFRVNDQFPVVQQGADWNGTDILQTPIYNGYSVHFFYDFPTQYSPATPNFAANYVRAIPDSSTGNTLTVQLQGHDTYIDPQTYDMSVNNYVNLQSGIVATVVDDNQTICTGLSDSTGLVQFTGAFTRANTYIVKTVSQYSPGGGPVDPGVYFTYTGAYSKVVAP